MSERKQTIEVVVTNLHRFSSFRELFETKLFNQCGCDRLTIEEAVNSMRQYYTEKDEEKYGVIGIEICITEDEK